MNKYMNRPKEELIADLKFCQDLMNHLVRYAEDYYKDRGVDRKNTVIQDDIRKIRRELMEISNSLKWDYIVKSE